MATLRRVLEGEQYQGSNESIAYVIDTTPWGGSPSSTAAVISSVGVGEALTDVTSTKMSGSTSVSGDDITLPTVTALVAGTLYRVRVTFTTSGNICSVVFDIQGEY